MPLAQLAFGGVEPLAQVDEGERQMACPTDGFGLVVATGGLHEGPVAVAEFGGEPVGLGEREGRQVAPDLERGRSGLAGHAELAESAERPQERGVPAAVEPEAEGRRRGGEVEVEAGGFGVEPVGEAAQ